MKKLKNDKLPETALRIGSVNHSISNLKEGDCIAFSFTYNGDESELMVSNITVVKDNEVLTHFFVRASFSLRIR